MNFLADILISLLELMEAEGRSLRRNALRVGLAIVAYAIAGAFLIAGTLLLLAGLHAILAARYGMTAAHFATGGLALAMAAGVFAVGTQIAHGRKIAAEGGGEAVENDRHVEDVREGAGAFAGRGEGELSQVDERS